MKYYIKIVGRFNIRNAGFKAPSDVEKILEKSGYTPICVVEPFKNKRFISKLIAMFQYLFIFFKIDKKDVIFLQYPNYLHKVDLLYTILFKKQARLQILIHDLDSLRVPDYTESVELLQKADVVIAHTPKMKEILQEKFGLQNDIKILNLFDYLLECDYKTTSTLKESLIYAGNLTGNEFLKKIKTKTYVYGKKQDWLNQNNNLQYQGEFDPNNLPDLKGDWGLLWYGESINHFDDTLCYRYFTFNASHKISLYLAAGKPILTWSKTAMGEFINKEKLGITVDSLSDIEEALLALTDSDKETILHNVKVYGEKIRKGEMLTSILKVI